MLHNHHKDDEAYRGLHELMTVHIQREYYYDDNTHTCVQSRLHITLTYFQPQCVACCFYISVPTELQVTLTKSEQNLCILGLRASVIWCGTDPASM